MGIAHWDDVEPRDLRRGPMQLDRTTRPRRGHEGGLSPAEARPGRPLLPRDVELDEEEIFYVLAGTGLSWQSGKTYEVRPAT